MRFPRSPLAVLPSTAKHVGYLEWLALYAIRVAQRGKSIFYCGLGIFTVVVYRMFRHETVVERDSFDGEFDLLSAQESFTNSGIGPPSSHARFTSAGAVTSREKWGDTPIYSLGLLRQGRRILL